MGVEVELSLSKEEIQKLPESDKREIAFFIYACVQITKEKNGNTELHDIDRQL